MRKFQLKRFTIGVLIAVANLLLTAHPAFAMNHYGAKNFVELGSSTTLFDFTEFNEDGTRSVGERGAIYGGKADFGRNFETVYLGGNASLMRGDVKYDGLTQSGKPHITNTTEIISDFSLRVGKTLGTWRSDWQALLYVDLGYAQWVRDIKTTSNGVVGLFEIYEWKYLNFGARGYLARTAKFSSMMELNISRTVQPRMLVDYKGRFADSALSLGASYGMRMTLPNYYALNKNYLLMFEPYVMVRDLGRSPHIVLTDTDGFTAGAVHEPRSATKLYGATLGLRFQF